VLPIDDLRDLREFATGVGAAIHMDGARIWNAHVATGVPLVEYGAIADVLAVCLSKGLGAPIGSLMVGTADAVAEARIWRKRMGGGMRQVGILAAGGLHALEHHVERLAEDHARARRLAEGLATLPGLELDPATVETNIVLFAVPDGIAFCAALAAEDVAMSHFGPHSVRAVTHLDVDDAGGRAGAVLAATPARKGG
jgi:threonine aldolase